MSRTIRKDGYGIKYAEGRYRFNYAWTHNCRCSYCTGVDRKKTTEDTFDRILKEELEDYHADVDSEGLYLGFQSTPG